jgi:uncharacterized protein with von Willebrand factor type A (vWA) domain
MTPLPFSDFLELLRAKGFGVGLHEHLALGKLIERWDSTDRDQLRNAIAALVARHDEEVRQIAALFDECYPIERVVAGEGVSAGGQIKEKHFRLVRAIRSARIWLVGLVLASGLAAGLIAIGLLVNTPLPTLPASPFAPLDRPAIFVDPAGIVVPNSVVESPPDVGGPMPTSPPRTNWRGLAWLGGLTLVVALASFWGARLRAGARRWTADAWESALASMPGPFHAALVLKDLITRLPRADVEEAATVLGRSFSRDRPGRLLDVRESLRQTLRSGMQPHLIFRPRRIPQAILVLQDVSQSMVAHTRRVDSLCRDFQRQGIALDRWFFDGDIGLPARRRFGVPVALDTLLRTREDGPVMILSAGFGVPAALAQSEREWMHALAKQTRRVWVNPILDPKLWPSALQRLPLTVVPMTRAGLLQAAKRLTHDDRMTGPGLGRALTAPRPVTAGDVEQLRRIASLVPYPTTELLELLRQQFAPGIPESAVLYAVDRHAAGTGLPFRMSDSEIREQLRRIRAESPALEARVRTYLLKVLSDSEPPPDSAAHLRWEASVAIHHVQLAELERTDGRAAVDALQRLYRGPLWEEIRDIVGRQSSAGPVTTQLRTAVKVKRRPDPPAYVDRTGTAEVERPRWAAPGWRELAAALVVALFVSAAAAFTAPFHSRAPQLADALRLEYLPPITSTDAGRLEVRPRADLPLPLSVALYRDRVATGAAISVDAGNPATVPLPSSAAAVYQVRGTLRDGTLAFSNSLWAPSVVVVIDAQPWANVTVAAADGKVPNAVQTTPVAIRLPEGRYTLSFENGGLTGPLTQTIDVTGGGRRSFRFDMPGFTVTDVLKNLNPYRGQSKK